MPDNYRLFSCEMDALSDEELAWCRRELARREFDEGSEFGADFEWSVEVDGEGVRSLWIRSEDAGNANDVAHFVQAFLKQFRPDTCWWMSWADTCSKPRVGEFCGGAVFVTAETIEHVDACTWAAGKVVAFQAAKPRAEEG